MENFIPKKAETIAAKRQNRLLTKLGGNKHRAITNAWWQGDLFEVLGMVLIFSLNIYLISPLLGGIDQGTTFSGPVIPLLANAVVFITQAPFPFAVQLTHTLFFLVFPVSFYVLVQFLTGRKLTALISVLLSTLPVYLFAGARISAGFFKGDGPHTASLGLMPLGIYSLILFLRDGGIKHLVFSSLLNALIVLISPFGFITFTALAVFVTFSEMLLGNGRLKVARFALTLIAAFGLASFWYNPALAASLAFGPLGGEMRELIGHILPLSLFGAPILGACGYLLFDRKANQQPFFIAIFWTVVFFVAVVVGQNSFIPSNASRYLPELGISLSLLLGLGIVKLIDTLKAAQTGFIPKISNPAFSNPIITLILALLVFSIIFFKKGVYLKEHETVLLWSVSFKGKLWLALESFDKVSSTVGTIITVVAIIVLAFLMLKARAGKQRL